MSAISVKVDLSGLLEIGQVITSEILPRVREAVGGIASQGQKDWADAVMKAPGIWSEEKKSYVNSIKWEYTGDFSARVSADYKYAQQIEDGRPARDLKVMLNTSMKVRVVKSGKNQGKRYLIIPFRHNTPGNTALAPAMPKEIAALAKNLETSKIVGHGWRESGTGASSIRSKKAAMVRSRKYEWGGRLDGEGIPQRYQGMVKMNTAGGEAKGRSSTYLTFRVMMEGSPGWIVQPKPGLKLMDGVVNRLQPVAEQVIAKAVQLDLSGKR